MILISTDTVVVCLETKRVCVSQIIVTVTKSFFFCMYNTLRQATLGQYE